VWISVDDPEGDVNAMAFVELIFIGIVAK